MTYTLSVGGHKDNETPEDVDALLSAARAFREAAEARGYSCQGTLSAGGNSHSLSG